jgi:uncharacterized membrane protein
MGGEFVIVVLVLLFLGAVAVAVLVLPIIALIRTNRIQDLRRRLEELETEVAELRRLPPRPTEAAPPPVPAAPEAMMDVLPAEPAPAAPTPPQPAPAPAPAATATDSLRDLEDWIGRRGLGWVAVILLLFAAAFFLKYAFENEWVGELGRVAIGVVAGIALCGAGLRYHERGWRIFSQMLTAGGVVLLYLATFASFGYYHLLPREAAGVFLVILIAETAALALLYDAPAIALMAVIGGLLNPLLLRTEHDQYRSLFIYLTLLNAGAVALTLFRRWWAIGTVALVGSQLLFWGWYDVNFHPEKLGAALAFQTALFVLFIVYGLLSHTLRARNANLEDLIRLVVNAVFFAIAAYVLLDTDYHVWMGSLAITLAIMYTALAWLVLRRRPEDGRQLFVTIAVALGFVAMAFPLQGEGSWIAVGWAAEAAVLLWFGMRIRAAGLSGMGVVLLVLAVGRILFVDTPEYLSESRLARHWQFLPLGSGEKNFLGVPVPLVHPYGLSFLAVILCIWAVVVAGRRFRGRLTVLDRTGLVVLAVAGTGLMWLLLTIETYVYAHDLFGDRPAQTALSAVWAGYAVILLASGFRYGQAALRWAALALFGLTLAKVFFIDMSQLPGFYRVIAFFALAVMMGIAAWAYQKFQLGRLVSGPEVADEHAS